ncbi:MAG: FkbM family methyltransferase [Gammaproteobacteria bacterium]
MGKSAKREPLYLEMLGRGLGDGPMTLISVGSSDGVECMYALQKKHDVTVHLLEPDPESLELCKKNIFRMFPENENQVYFHNLAVSDREGDGIFFRNPESPNLNSASQTNKANIELNVNYITLDRFIKENNIHPPIMVNMDIEGHEVEVLEGFFEFAKKNSPIKILMEVHPSLYTKEHSLEKTLKKYFAIGFRATYLESAGLPDPEKFKQKGLRPFMTQKSRGLYTNLEEDFVLETACHENFDVIDKSGRMTKKIVRSLLIEKVQ